MIHALANGKIMENKMTYKGHCDSYVVSVLTFFSDNPSSNSAEVYTFYAKNVVEKSNNKQKDGGVKKEWRYGAIPSLSLLLTQLEVYIVLKLKNYFGLYSMLTILFFRCILELKININLDSMTRNIILLSLKYGRNLVSFC